MTTEIARHRLHFHSPQRPHEIQAWLERHLRSVLTPIPGEARATFQSAFSWAGFHFQLRLVYEAAYPAEDTYTFHMNSEANSLPKDLPALQRSANSWFSVWTREWKPAPTQIHATPSEDLYAARTNEWLQIHSSLQDPQQLQTTILEAMRQGATFSTAHKEGGTVIRFAENRWCRSNYGESNDYEIFHTPEAFLTFLRQFYDFEVSRTLWPNKAPTPPPGASSTAKSSHRGRHSLMRPVATYYPSSLHLDVSPRVDLGTRTSASTGKPLSADLACKLFRGFSKRGLAAGGRANRAARAPVHAQHKRTGSSRLSNAALQMPEAIRHHRATRQCKSSGSSAWKIVFVRFAGSRCGLLCRLGLRANSRQPQARATSSSIGRRAVCGSCR